MSQKNTIGFLIYEVPRVIRFVETENSRWWWPGAAGGNKGNRCFMGRVSDLQDRKVLEICFVTM